MASESSVPPNPSDAAPQKSSEAVQPMSEVQQVAKSEPPQPSPPSVFVNSEPMREDQVQNAVKFLSHPKVRGSPVMYRRSFLEKKGLTKEEIDEAFRRVPDPSPSVQATNLNQEGQVKSTPTVQPPAPTQTLQPIAAAQTGVVSSMGTVAQPRFHWYHAILAVGVLTVSSASAAVLIKKSIIPRLKSWIRKVVLEEEVDEVKKPQAKPSLAEEAAAAAKSAAAAAADIAKASQEMLISKNEEKRYFGELMNLLDVQVREMKSMGASIRKLEGQTNNFARTFSADQEDHRYSSDNKIYMNGKAENDSRSVRSSSPPSSTEPSAAPHPKSYMEILTMVQRGEKPPNIRDIDDRPPNPNQQISSSRMVPRAKPWESAQPQSFASGNGLNSKVQDNGVTYLMDSESNAPLWQQKTAKITEIENEDEPKSGSAVTTEVPVQRRWVPPQPPPVVMPEAAEAIRRPKQFTQKDQAADDQNVSNPTDAADELRRLTKFSETGGAVGMNGGGSGIDSSEIQEVQE